jgi:hypothetical protein
MGFFRDRTKAGAEAKSRSQRQRKQSASFHVEALEPRLLLNSAPVAAPLSVPEASQSSEAVVLVHDLQDSIKISFEGWGDSSKDNTPPSSLLDLSSSANNGRKISVQVKADRHVDVKGAADGDFSLQGIEKILGNEKATIELVAPDVDTVFEITGKDAGILQSGDSPQIEFAGVQSLAGGSGNDTLDYSSYSTGVVVDLSQGTATDTSSVRSVENVIGGSGDDRFTVSDKVSGDAAVTISGGKGNDALAVTDGSNTWVIEGENSGTLNAMTFAGIENLAGGTGDDTFIVSVNGHVAGAISGGFGNDTLVGANQNNTWIVIGQNAGNVNGQSFSDIENLVGGNANDVFVFAGGRITGSVDGGDGNNTVRVTDSLLAVDSDPVAAPTEVAPAEAKVEVDTGEPVAPTNVQEVYSAPILETVNDDTLTVIVSTADQSANKTTVDEASVADDNQDVVALTSANSDSLNTTAAPSENHAIIENTAASEIDSDVAPHPLLDALKDVLALTYAGLFAGVVVEGFDEKLQDRERQSPSQLDNSRGPPHDDDTSGSIGFTSNAENSKPAVAIEDSSAPAKGQQELLLQASDASGGSPVLESEPDEISAGFAGSLTDQLTETLNAANAPPASSDSSLALTVADSPAVSSSAPLTSEDLAPVLDQALQLWIGSELSVEQVHLLNSISVNISDLADGLLGETNGTDIALDVTAAGHGWFVDPTPAENSEFGTVINASRLAAEPGSSAFARIDLLTVLLHEMGHVLGLSHDSDLEVMHETLRNGERVLLGNDNVPLASESVSAALGSDSLGTLTTDAGDFDPVTFRLFDDNGNGSIDVEISNAASGNGIYDDIGVIDGTAAAHGTVVVDLSSDTVWTIDGSDAGTVAIDGFAAVEFSGIENLLGAADNNDSFIFSAGGAISGVVDGGTGGFDSLTVDATYGTLVLSPAGPDSGTVEFDGNVIAYAGLEPVNAGSPTNVIFNGTAGADNWVIEDSATAGQIQIRSTNGAIETQSFGVPTSLTLNTAGGDDTIALNQTRQIASIVIDGGAGNNALNVSALPATFAAFEDSVSMTLSDGTHTISATNIIPPAGATLGVRALATLDGGEAWTPVGPYTDTGAQVEGMEAQGNPVAGAVNLVAIDPNNSNTAYLATPNGGIWKSTDFLATTTQNGQTVPSPTWTQMSDQNPTLSISALVIDPTDSTVLFAGAGNRSSSYQAGDLAGLLKSENSGGTWKQIGGDVFMSLTINSILVFHGPDKLLVGTTGGVYTSGLGGENPTKVAGALPDGIVSDLIRQPGTDNVFAAVVGKGIYKSTDRGDVNWAKVLALPSSERVKFAVAANGTVYVAALGQNTQVAAPVLAGDNTVNQTRLAVDSIADITGSINGPTTITGLTANTITVANINGFADGLTVYVGSGGTLEPVTIAVNGVNTGTKTITLTANLVNAHVNGDPVQVLDGGETTVSIVQTTWITAFTPNTITVDNIVGFDPGDRIIVGIGASIEVATVAPGGVNAGTKTLTLVANLTKPHTIDDPVRLNFQPGVPVTAVDTLNNVVTLAANLNFNAPVGRSVIFGNERLVNLFKTIDGGANWTPVTVPTTDETGNSNRKVVGLHLSGQGDLHFSMLVDPSDPNTIYLGGDIQPLDSTTYVLTADAAVNAGSISLEMTAKVSRSPLSMQHPRRRVFV